MYFKSHLHFAQYYFFIYRAKNKTVKQKLKYKSANIATFKLNTDIYYLEYSHF